MFVAVQKSWNHIFASFVYGYETGRAQLYINRVWRTFFHILHIHTHTHRDGEGEVLVGWQSSSYLYLKGGQLCPRLKTPILFSPPALEKRDSGNLTNPLCFVDTYVPTYYLVLSLVGIWGQTWTRVAISSSSAIFYACRPRTLAACILEISFLLFVLAAR